MKTSIMNRILAKSLVATVALATTAGLSSANAASYTWNASKSGNWSTGPNWIGDVAPSTTGGEDLIFGGTGGGLQLRTTTNNISSDYPVNSITFSGSTGYRLTGSSLLINGNIANTTNRTQTIENNITTGFSPVEMSAVSSTSGLSLSGTFTNNAGINLTGRISFTQAIVGNGDVTLGTTANVTLGANRSDGIRDLTSGGRLNIGSNNGTGSMILDTRKANFLSTSTTTLKVGTDSGGAIIPGLTFDQIVSTGTVCFSGNLTMNFAQMAIDPNALEPFNTAWKLFGAMGYDGNFTSMTVINAPGDYDNLNGEWTLENGSWVSKTISNAAGNQYFAFDQATGQLVVVPEPSTIVFGVLGVTISGVHCINKRRRNKSAIAA